MVKLNDLINRGDVISITNGKLHITPKSGKPVPSDWLHIHQNSLLSELSCVIAQPIYQFKQFKVGRYLSKYDGLTMSFTDLSFHEDYYTIFNVSLDRKKGGGRLKGKLFNPPAQGALLKFWSRSNLPKPRRPSELYKKINMMKNYLWQGEVSEKNKIETQSLRLANITHQQILDAISGGVSEAHERQSSGVMVSSNSGALSGQNKEAFIGGSELPNSHIYQSVESSLTTCVYNHGDNKPRVSTSTGSNKHDISKQGSAVSSEALPPSIEHYKGANTQRPQDKTHEEWWSEYDNAKQYYKPEY